MFLSIIIPAYNEAKVISKTVNDILAYLQSKDFSFEIIIVDDGSADETEQVLSGLSVQVIKHERNLGKGAAVKTGFLAAKGEWLLFMDADNATNIRELDTFLPFTDQFKIIIGSRAVPGAKIIKPQPFYKELLGKIANFLIKKKLHLRVKDTQCGFKLFQKSTLYLFKDLKVRGWGFDFAVLAQANHDGIMIKELPVEWQDGGKSSVKLIDYIKTLIELINLRG